MDILTAWTRRSPDGTVLDTYAATPGGQVYRITNHRPWFLADRCPLSAAACEETDIQLMVWDDASLTHRPGPRAWRIETVQPRQVKETAEALETEEAIVSMANVRYEARLSLDLYAAGHTVFGVKAPAILYTSGSELAEVLAQVYERSMEIKIAAVDIEVRSTRGGFPRPGDPVFLVSASLITPGGEPETAVLEGDEVHDLPRLLKSWRPSLVAGFNSSDFDSMYYSAFHGARVWTREMFDADGYPIPHIDLLEFLDAHGSSLGLTEGRRYALDDAAEALGLASREELEVEEAVERAKIWELYLEKPDLVKRYARVDAELTAKLAAYVAPVLAVLAALTGVAVNVIPQLPSMGSLAEYAVYEVAMRRSRRAYQLRSRSYSIRGLPEHVAGRVYSNRYKDYFTHPRIDDNVIEYDFNMLYPSIYASASLGPESSECPDGFPVPLAADSGEVRWARICGNPRDPVAETLTKIYDARAATKKLKKARGIEAPDQAVKILANSAYGMYSKGRGMGLHEGVAGYIFFYANKVMDELVRWLESRGAEVVYTATDSLFVKWPGMDPEEGEETLNKVVAERAGHRFSLKLEAVFKRLALIAKKTYVGVTESGETLVKGMEKLQIPRGLKDRLGEYFSGVLYGADPVQLAQRILGGLEDVELHVRTSKRLDSVLWDRKEARWKQVNNPGMRAVLATWMLTEGVREARFDWAGLPGYSVVAHWLPLAPDRQLVMEPGGGGHYSCRVRVEPDGAAVRVAADCRKFAVSRRELERLAYRASSVVVGYGRVVRSVAATRKLTAYLR